MKRFERVIWITVIIFLIFTLSFIIIVKKASASNDLSNQLLLKKISTVLSIIERDYVDPEKIDKTKLINGAIDGMLKALDDPHTSYLPKEYWEQLTSTSSGTYGGIGLHISQKNDMIIVVSPIEGTPAYKKGIKAGDYILSVDGQSLKGVSVEKAASMLRGEPGTTVKLEILSNGITYTVELVRENIVLPTVKSAIIDKKFGYLRITEFSGKTPEKVKKTLQEFKENKVKGIIVDLRYNPGGLLSSVIEIADYFLSEGIIVSTQSRYNKEESKAKYFDTIVKPEIPVIVLIDSGSASASEIFAAALKDNNRAILIGEKSYGKGSVQSIYQLGEHDGFKLTIAKYFTPSGVSIEGVGITPDIVLKEPELTDEEKIILKKLYTDKAIDNLLKNVNVKDINFETLDVLVKELQNKGYKLPERILKKLIKNAIELELPTKEIYDLEYDLQLKKAVEILESGIEVKDKKIYLKN